MSAAAIPASLSGSPVAPSWKEGRGRAVSVPVQAANKNRELPARYQPISHGLGFSCWLSTVGGAQTGQGQRTANGEMKWALPSPSEG